MTDETKIDPSHSTTRTILRLLGPAVAVVGLVLILIGFGSFFASFGGFEPPRYFWCAFLGIPLFFVGIALSMFAFLGSFARYFSAEAAPVQKDTFNYLAGGTKEGVKTIAQAIGEGLSAGNVGIRCLRCNQGNEADAKFCKHCGSPLTK